MGYTALDYISSVGIVVELGVRVDLPVAVVVAASADADVGEGAGVLHRVRVRNEWR